MAAKRLAVVRSAIWLRSPTIRKSKATRTASQPSKAWNAASRCAGAVMSPRSIRAPSFSPDCRAANQLDGNVTFSGLLKKQCGEEDRPEVRSGGRAAYPREVVDFA